MTTLMRGDCLDLMASITDGSVDMVLCDLPYGVLNKSSEGGKWDSVIPMEPLWAEWRRVTRPGAAVVLFCQGMFTARLMASNPGMWRYNLVWNKVLKSGFLNANRMPLRQHEDIAVFYDRQPTYNPQMTECPPERRNHPQGGGVHRRTSRCYGAHGESKTVPSDMKHPTSILSFPRKHDVGRAYHPTEKPVPLLEWLVRTYTNPGDLVLDSCMGSGSTGVACVNAGRDFVGIELDEGYFAVAHERIAEAEREKSQKLF